MIVEGYGSWKVIVEGYEICGVIRWGTEKLVSGEMGNRKVTE